MEIDLKGCYRSTEFCLFLKKMKPESQPKIDFQSLL